MPCLVCRPSNYNFNWAAIMRLQTSVHGRFRPSPYKEKRQKWQNGKRQQKHRRKQISLINSRGRISSLYIEEKTLTRCMRSQEATSYTILHESHSMLIVINQPALFLIATRQVHMGTHTYNVVVTWLSGSSMCRFGSNIVQVNLQVWFRKYTKHDTQEDFIYIFFCSKLS